MANPGGNRPFLVQIARQIFFRLSNLSIELRRTKTVLAVIEEIVSQGRTQFRPGDVATVLRDRGQPLGVWAIQGEFAILEAEGLIKLDPATAHYLLDESAARKVS